jgi:hypothetical protein
MLPKKTQSTRNDRKRLIGRRAAAAAADDDGA